MSDFCWAQRALEAMLQRCMRNAALEFTRLAGELEKQRPVRIAHAPAPRPLPTPGGRRRL